MIGWPDGDTYFIENIGVDPQSQGHGLGRRLIKHTVIEAKRHRLQG
jgi:ribosomal protein S18 acetylase RimI-like enzyme